MTSLIQHCTIDQSWHCLPLHGRFPLEFGVVACCCSTAVALGSHVTESECEPVSLVRFSHTHTLHCDIGGRFCSSERNGHLFFRLAVRFPSAFATLRLMLRSVLRVLFCGFFGGGTRNSRDHSGKVVSTASVVVCQLAQRQSSFTSPPLHFWYSLSICRCSSAARICSL